MADQVQYYGTGRRKSAIARVFLRPGTGEWKVNGKGFDEYFVTEQQRVAAKRSLVVADMASSFDVVTTVKSGGVAAQADAVKMGVARALIEFNAELRKTLKAEGLLTRDARVKERKKYGQKGARKRFQFSKR
ncbi:30S ribosomal protein S9 [Acidobacteria bacterium AB60]|nr:30S ribosomal protein S9 [Acidobacteria bacterium AB60]